jgi:hypothetical protein
MDSRDWRIAGNKEGIEGINEVKFVFMLIRK